MSTEAARDYESCLLEGMQSIQEGHTLIEAPENKIQNIYALAYMLYQQKEYQDSGCFFRLLVIARPTEAKYWKGLGSCLQMLKNFEEALNCYHCCFEMSDRYHFDPYFYIQISDCFFALNQIDAGLKALESALFHAKDRQNHHVIQHVELMKQSWGKLQ